MKKPFIKFIILFSGILFGFQNFRAQACSYGTEFEDIRFILLNPNLGGNKAWWSFFYTSNLHYLDGSIQGDSDEKAIALEWKTKFHLKSDVESIQNFLFGAYKKDSLIRMSFAAEINKNKALSDYFSFAKNCENAIYSPDPWESIYTDSLILIRKNLIVEGIQKAKNAKDEFWKKKYAFQILRLAYYQNDGELFNETFHRNFKLGEEKTPIDWWATHYKSMVLERYNEIDSANYLHALVFSNCSNKMFVSRQWYSPKNFPAQLKLAKNDRERADLYVLREITNHGHSLEGIQNVYRLAPNHPLLPLLLIREVNKIENWTNTRSSWYWEGFQSKNVKADYAYARFLLKALHDMHEFESSNAELFHLICTNLALLTADPKTAQAHLAQIESQEPQVKFQKNVFEILITTLTENIETEETQNKLGILMQNLIESREGQFESQKISFSVFKYVQNVFEQKELFHLAGLMHYIAEDKLCNSCFLQSDEYSVVQYFDLKSNSDINEKVLAIFIKKDKNQLEKLLLKPYPNPNFFYDVSGTVYMREGNVQRAFETFSKIPEDFWLSDDRAMTYLDVDPFCIVSGPGCKYMYYTKTSIAKQILDIEKKQTKTARDFMVCGHAWYNFSRFGNSWYMMNYYNQNYPDEHLLKVSDIALVRAGENYKNALVLSQDDNEKSEILFGTASVYLKLKQKQKYYAAAEMFEKLNEQRFHSWALCSLTEYASDRKTRDANLKGYFEKEEY